MLETIIYGVVNSWGCSQSCKLGTFL